MLRAILLTVILITNPAQAALNNAISCSPSAQVVVIGEKHKNFASQSVRGLLAELGQLKGAYTFVEGPFYSKRESENASTYFGLEDRLIASFVKLRLASVTLQALTAVRGDLSFDESKAKDLSVQAFMEGLINTIEWWPDVQRPFESAQTESLARNFDAYLHSYERARGTNARAAARRELITQFYVKHPLENGFTIAQLAESGHALATALEKRIRSDSNYDFLASVPAARFLGDGREMIFAANIIENYCNANTQKQKLLVQVGDGHRKQLARLLETKLGQSHLVEAIVAEDVEKKLSQWVKGLEADSLKLRPVLQAADPDLTYVVHRDFDQPHRAVFWFKKPINAALQRVVVQKIEDAGYMVVSKTNEVVKVITNPFETKP